MTTIDSMVGMSSSMPQMTAAATSPDDDNMFEVIIGNPCLQAPEPISLLEALDTAHFVLHQVWLVFQREQEEQGAEQQHLKDWGSMLKVWTMSMQLKAIENRAYLDKLGEVLKEE
jgi:hypothetical protein